MKGLIALLSLISLTRIFLIMPAEAQCGEPDSPKLPARTENRDAIYSLEELETITADNVHRLQQVSLLSIGSMNYWSDGYEIWRYSPLSSGLVWLPDGSTMVLPTAQGVFLYNTEQPDAPPYLLPYSVPSAWAVTDSTGELLLTMDADGSQMTLWSLAKRSPLASTPILPANLDTYLISPEPQFTPDGAFIIVMGRDSQPGTYRWQRYSVDTLELVDTLLQSSLHVTNYVLGPDHLGVITEEGTGYLLDVRDGTTHAEFPEAQQLLFSQDYQRLFVVTSRSVQVWDVATLTMVHDISLAGEIRSIDEANNTMAIFYHPDVIDEAYLNRLALYDLTSLSNQPRATMMTGAGSGEFNAQGDRLAIVQGRRFNIVLTKQADRAPTSIVDTLASINLSLEYSQPISDTFSLREPLQLKFASGCGWNPALPADGRTGEPLDQVWPDEFYWDDLPNNLSDAEVTSVFAIAPNESVIAVIAEDTQDRHASVVIHDLNTGEALITLEHPAWRNLFYAEFYGKEGKLLFVSTVDEAITVWGVPPPTTSRTKRVG
jgi:hypothetical protein